MIGELISILNEMMYGKKEERRYCQRLQHGKEKQVRLLKVD
jgi:hypothetical protein